MNRPTSTSSRTRSASTTTDPVVIALGSNLGDRQWHLRRALHELQPLVRLVRISSIHETEPVDAPPGSPRFLNMAVAGLTSLQPHELLHSLLDIEARLGRIRTVRNAPRVIDLDLIFFGARRIRTSDLVVPHPRYQHREFVLAPLREIEWPGIGSRYSVPGTREALPKTEHRRPMKPASARGVATACRNRR